MITPDTPVIRLLADHGISFRLLAHTAPVFSVEEAAKERGVDVAEMVKCLVFFPKQQWRLIVACIPGDRRLSLSKLKATSGAKSLRATDREAIAVAVGYPVGAIPPIALPDDAEVFVDRGLLNRARLNISAGDPAVGLELRLQDFRQIVRGRFVDLVE
jgi:Cys-tRNA(Pro)/Cys-tRNA(Cys) deacylase